MYMSSLISYLVLGHIEVLDNTLDEIQLFLEVTRGYAARTIQDESDISLGTATWDTIYGIVDWSRDFASNQIPIEMQ